MKELFNKISDRSAQVAVIGLGYVGLPLAIEIAKSGFRTFGIDVSTQKINLINEGKNYIKDVPDETLTSLVRQGTFSATTDYNVLSSCDFVSICVPTPLGKGKDPDMSFIMNAILEVKKTLRKNQVIILESTTYPGTTEEIVLPALQETKLKVGEGFYLAFSPERIDPGNQQYGIKNTPKIIGGVTRNCTEIAQAFYQTFVDQVIAVSSTRSAEMVKMLENTFRAINIGLANEIAIICNHLGIDTWEVIEAAATKPFGYTPFYPGPGLGGHCIPVDPHYLMWKLKSLNYNARFIQLADEINSSMPGLVTEKIVRSLNERKIAVNGSKILILGVAYKKDISDCRESPALDIIRLLNQRGAKISYHDPYVPELIIDNISLASVSIKEGLNAFDCVAILTHHSSFDIEKIVEESKLIVDTRNATKGVRAPDKIIKL